MKWYKQLLHWLVFMHQFHMADDDGGGDAGDAGDADGADGADGSNWFPENWRQEMAGDDAKALKQLERYATPKDVWNKTRALEQRMSSGELKEVTAFPAEGTAEEQAAWRTANGIPESADKYELDVPNEAREGLQPFLDYAHQSNLTPQAVEAMLGFFRQTSEQAEEAQATLDAEAKKHGEDTLRAEWGNEYRAHINQIEAMLDLAPDDMAEDIKNARMPDGTKLWDNPAAMQMLLQGANALNPSTALVGDGKVGTVDEIQAEIRQIQKVMREDRKSYDNDQAMQDRFQFLLAERDKRGAA